MDVAQHAPAAPPLTALRHKHLLGIADLSADEIVLVLDTAEAMKEVGQRTIKKVPTLRGRTVINLFFEPSTRTRTSFEIAEKRLSADTLNVAIASSSVVKGETLVDTAMNLGFAVHLVLAGFAMYLLLRALGVSWAAGIVGGVAYELTGIVASLVKPGHDGKLFVSALAPLAFLALLKAVRDRNPAGYALLALVVGLGLLSPHYQMTYYLLVAAGLWTLYLAFFAPERPSRRDGAVSVALALGAVLLGVTLSGGEVDR